MRVRFSPVLAAAVIGAGVGAALAGSPSVYAATKTTLPKAGATCKASQLGQVIVSGGRRLVCAQIGSKRQWTAALPPVPSAATTPSTAPAPAVVFRDDFSNINGGWTVITLPVGEAGYRDEKYQLFARRPSDPAPPPGQGTTMPPSTLPTYFGVRAPGLTNLSGVTVEIEAKMLSSSGAFAVGCYDNGAPEESTRYEGVITLDDKWIVNEVRNGRATTLAAGDLQLNVLRRGAAPNQFRVACTGAPGGPGRITLALNGQTVAQKMVSAMLPAGQVSIWSIAYPGVPGSQVLFNNIVVIRG